MLLLNTSISISISFFSLITSPISFPAPRLHINFLLFLLHLGCVPISFLVPMDNGFLNICLGIWAVPLNTRLFSDELFFVISLSFYSSWKLLLEWKSLQKSGILPLQQLFRNLALRKLFWTAVPSSLLYPLLSLLPI